MTGDYALLLGLIGPPSVGKTTVVEALAGSGIPTLRLEEFAESHRGGFRATYGFEFDPSRAATVDVLLQAAFERRGFPPAPVVVLHGLPAAIPHVGFLHEIAQGCNARFGVVELYTSDIFLLGRYLNHRVCLDCADDISSGNVDPAALTSMAHPNCARCGSVLPDSESVVSAFSERLHQYAQSRLLLRGVAADLGIPWTKLDTSNSEVASCVQGVRTVIDLMMAVPVPDCVSSTLMVRCDDSGQWVSYRSTAGSPPGRDSPPGVP